MRLLVIRHAIAIARGAPGIADDQRPLTPRGERRFRQAARGLARISGRPDVLLASPLPRALRTAEIAARAWGRITPTIEPVLAPGLAAGLFGVLASQPEDATVALVGHEPDVSELLARLLGSAEAERFTFRKGGVALVDLPGAPTGGGRLVWYLSPKILRALART